MNQTGTIILSGEDSKNFIREIIHPDEEHIQKVSNKLKEINENITIHREGTSTIAEIKNLDLSFLDNQLEE